MTQINSIGAEPKGPVVTVNPQPDVYTVLLAIAIVALVVSTVAVLWHLTSSLPTGYGLSLKDVFSSGPAPLAP